MSLRPARSLLVPTLLGAALVAPGGVAPDGDRAGVGRRDTATLSARLAVVAHSIEGERRRLGVPGAAVAIVRDDRVILLKGFGFRDREAGRPVTPQTLFSIGSCTKPFTALATIISADRGLVSLDDSPKKFLPWFTLRDPEADARVTLRDLLSHRTGVPDDLPAGWFERYPTHAELIRAAMGSKPNAAFRDRFNYNNYMYLAAGEALAVAHHVRFESVMTSLVLEPLGMRASTPSIGAMRKAADFSYPYGGAPRPKRYSMDTLAFLAGIAPAGGIVSNAGDMAQWVRLMLGGGALDGRRLVSEKGYQELLTPAVRTSGGQYGLGLFIEDWHGHRIYYHPGGVPGFGTRCVFVPDLGLGWVVLTNVDDQRLPKAIGELVYANLVTPR
jgi:CubicO group peptidase (beta-lactamase class C family)